MAEMKKTTKVTETKVSAPDEDIQTKEEITEGATDKPVQKAIINEPVKKSARKVHYKEFIAGKKLNRVFLAGFKMYLNGKEYMTESEWNETLNQYSNRNS